MTFEWWMFDVFCMVTLGGLIWAGCRGPGPGMTVKRTHHLVAFPKIQQGLDEIQGSLPLGTHTALVISGPMSGRWWQLQVYRWGLWVIGRVGHIVMVPRDRGQL